MLLLLYMEKSQQRRFGALGRVPVEVFWAPEGDTEEDLGHLGGSRSFSSTDQQVEDCLIFIPNST